MENFDQEMFEIDQQLRSLEEYDTSSDSDVDETEEVEDDQTQQPEHQNTFPGYAMHLTNSIFFCLINSEKYGCLVLTLFLIKKRSENLLL